jgi:hypothetical protein
LSYRLPAQVIGHSVLLKSTLSANAAHTGSEQRRRQDTDGRNVRAKNRVKRKRSDISDKEMLKKDLSFGRR